MKDMMSCLLLSASIFQAGLFCVKRRAWLGVLQSFGPQVLPLQGGVLRLAWKRRNTTALFLGSLLSALISPDQPWSALLSDGHANATAWTGVECTFVFIITLHRHCNHCHFHPYHYLHWFHPSRCVLFQKSIFPNSTNGLILIDWLIDWKESWQSILQGLLHNYNTTLALPWGMAWNLASSARQGWYI